MINPMLYNYGGMNYAAAGQPFYPPQGMAGYPPSYPNMPFYGAQYPGGQYYPGAAGALSAMPEDVAGFENQISAMVTKAIPPFLQEQQPGAGGYGTNAYGLNGYNPGSPAF